MHRKPDHQEIPDWVVIPFGLMLIAVLAWWIATIYF